LGMGETAGVRGLEESIFASTTRDRNRTELY
jgi:hypothetical protein